MGCSSIELAPTTCSTSWPPCLQFGLNDSIFLQALTTRKLATLCWMNQLDDFISFTEIWWTWNVDIICCACLRPERAAYFGMQVSLTHWLTHSLTGCRRWIFTHGSGAIGTVVLGSHFLSLCWTWKAAAHAHAHTHTHTHWNTHTHTQFPSESKLRSARDMGNYYSQTSTFQAPLYKDFLFSYTIL